MGEKIDGLEMVTEPSVNPGQGSEQRGLNNYKTKNMSSICIKKKKKNPQDKFFKQLRVYVCLLKHPLLQHSMACDCGEQSQPMFGKSNR